MLFLMGNDGDGLWAYIETYKAFLSLVFLFYERFSFAYKLCEVTCSTLEFSPHKSHIFDACVEPMVMDGVIDIIEQGEFKS